MHPIASTWENLLHWYGQYHFVLLHFPLAGALLAGAAELLYIWRKNPAFGFTAQFLLVSSAIFALFTVPAGLSLAEGRPIPAWSLLWWHRAFGISTLILCALAAILRPGKQRRLYLACLILFVLSASFTGDLGGRMTFRHFHWLP